MIRESGRRHGPIFGRVRAHWRPLEKATARSDAAGPPECPRFLSMKRRPAGHDVRICRAFVTLSGYVPGHSIRAAPGEARALADDRRRPLTASKRREQPETRFRPPGVIARRPGVAPCATDRSARDEEADARFRHSGSFAPDASYQRDPGARAARRSRQRRHCDRPGRALREPRRAIGFAQRQSSDPPRRDDCFATRRVAEGRIM
jgi:hypothetical protein